MTELRVKATVSFQLSIELQESYSADKSFSEIYQHALDEAVRMVQQVVAIPEYKAKMTLCGVPKIIAMIAERK